MKPRITKEYKSRVVRLHQKDGYIKPTANPIPDRITSDMISTPSVKRIHPKLVQENKETTSIEHHEIQQVQSIHEQVSKNTVPTIIRNKIITCINDYFDKIFCINLDRRTDRWNESTSEFSKYNLVVDRFQAVDGMHINNGKLTKWEIACFQSHVRLLRLIVDNQYERVLILEDDIEFINDLQNYFLRSVKLIPDDWKMLYFGGNHLNTPTQINSVIARTTRTYTTGAYGITNTMAQAVLTRIERTGISHQIDVYYSEFHRGGACYTYSPKIAWQRPGFSDIQQGIQDYTGIIK